VVFLVFNFICKESAFIVGLINILIELHVSTSFDTM